VNALSLQRSALLLTTLLALVVGAALRAEAQQPDSVRVQTSNPDTSYAREIRPPISARRAFLTSLVLPGYGQSVLGRKRSGAMMLAMEALSIVMIRESALGVREARRNAADSVVVAWVDGTGAAATKYQRTEFPTALIKARKGHVEDWVAVLVANHLFAGTDALVAAMLWDLPGEVSVNPERRSASLGFRFRF
jgi:hypothetical protein